MSVAADRNIYVESIQPEFQPPLVETQERTDSKKHVHFDIDSHSSSSDTSTSNGRSKGSRKAPKKKTKHRERTKELIKSIEPTVEAIVGRGADRQELEELLSSIRGRFRWYRRKISENDPDSGEEQASQSYREIESVTEELNDLIMADKYDMARVDFAVKKLEDISQSFTSQKANSKKHAREHRRQRSGRWF